MATKAKVKWEQKRKAGSKRGEEVGQSGAEGGAPSGDSDLAAGGSLLGCS